MTMTLEKNRVEFEGLEGVESPESETGKGYSVSWGKRKWSTIDANGNLIKDGEKTYTWDAANRLISVAYINPQPATSADNVTFQYDGFGRRTAITENHGNTVINSWTFVWCAGLLCEQRDSTGSIVVKRFFDQGEYIVSGSTKYFYTFDHLGSVREMVDSSGVSIQAQYDYDSYGRQTQLAGTQKAGFGYTSFFVEPATMLNLTWFRVYDPNKGRWLERDPLGEFTGNNLYAYVSNIVMNLIDSLGLIDNGDPSKPGKFPLPLPPEPPKPNPGPIKEPKKTPKPLPQKTPPPPPTYPVPTKLPTPGPYWAPAYTPTECILQPPMPQPSVCWFCPEGEDEPEKHDGKPVLPGEPPEPEKPPRLPGVSGGAP